MKRRCGLKNIGDRRHPEQISAQQVQFQRSCFGHFLDVKITKFVVQLFHHLVCKRCESSHQRELLFNIKGNILRFGTKEFSMIIYRLVV